MLESKRLYILADEVLKPNHFALHLLYVKPVVPAYALVTPSIVAKTQAFEEAIKNELSHLAGLLEIAEANVQIITAQLPRFAARRFASLHHLQILTGKSNRAMMLAAVSSPNSRVQERLQQLTSLSPQFLVC